MPLPPHHLPLWFHPQCLYTQQHPKVTHTHTHTHTHTCMHTRMHTHTCTHTQDYHTIQNTHQVERPQHDVDGVEVRPNQLLAVDLDIDSIAEELEQNAHQLSPQHQVTHRGQSEDMDMEQCHHKITILTTCTD